MISTPTAGRAARPLANVEDNLAERAELLRLGIELLEDPGRLYRQADDQNRRWLTHTFLDRLYVDDDGVSPGVLWPPFDDLVEALWCLPASSRAVR